jgi:hypothetical protein
MSRQLFKIYKSKTMKKSILSIAIVLAVISTAFGKHPSTVTQRAAASFQKDFYQASEVSWAETNNYVLATFSMNKETMFAYYDFQGNLIGLVHHILTTSLPESLRTDIKKHYGNYWVSELFQITNEQGVYYYIQLQNADETIVLSTEGTNGWHRYSMPK